MDKIFIISLLVSLFMHDNFINTYSHMHQDNYLGQRKRKAPRKFVISNRVKSM